MPTVGQNRRYWDRNYDWKDGGDEWSAAWGGAEMQWHATLLPRIRAFVPCRSVLEIGPGYGRWTAFLMDLCEQLVAVDVSESCVRACAERFAGSEHVRAYVNDGTSLEMVPDGSVDLVFSFDSLVHAEAAVIGAYLRQIARKLSRDGACFIHHSNAGEYARYYSMLDRARRGRGLLVRLGLADAVEHWRAFSMTAGRFAELADEAGLRCVGQELINWPTSSWRAIDCISVVTRPDSAWSRPNRVVRNRNFAREAESARALSGLYDARSFGQRARRPSAGAQPE